MIPMQRTLILGASGFLGRYIAKEFKEDALLHTRIEEPSFRTNYVSEFETEEDVIRLFNQNSFSTLINCIALADIDKCEKNLELAIWLNQTLPKLLAKHSTKNEKKIVHISTDAVFNGDLEFSREEDAKYPQNHYALTKLEGEKNVIQESRNFNIFRVNFYGKSPNQSGILEFFYEKLRSNQKIIGYNDVYFTPLYARETAKLIKLISKSSTNGVIHVAGTERLSKYEFGQKIALAMNKSRDLISPVNFDQSPLAVKRSLELSLSTERLRNLGYIIPSLESGICQAIEELEN